MIRHASLFSQLVALFNSTQFHNPLYRKLLRFYLDFCRKYRFPETERKSLDTESLSTDHVKAFLTFLAATKKVSASTQNQAFNALLFFYPHVLKQEFEKVKGFVTLKEVMSA